MGSSIPILFITVLTILSLIILWIALCDKNIIINYLVGVMFEGIESRENLTNYIDSKPDIDNFYNGAPKSGNYINFLKSATKQSKQFLGRPEFSVLIGKTIVLDIDDTLVYTKPYHHKPKEQEMHPKWGMVTHYEPLEPVVDLVKYSKSIGYNIVIITARPPEGYDNAMSNLNEIGVYPDALFTSVFWGQDPTFKSVMRNNIEHLSLENLKNMSSKELFEYQPISTTKHPLNIKLIMSIGDRWADIVGMKDVLGLKLSEIYDMNGYFWFNGETRIIQ
jgi:hypothetical protein